MCTYEAVCVHIRRERGAVYLAACVHMWRERDAACVLIRWYVYTCGGREALYVYMLGGMCTY